jgi:cell shape-determining protein MreC
VLIDSITQEPNANIYAMFDFLKFLKKKKTSEQSLEKIKLENELLKDKVKQLEAQVKTLEKALDKALK